MGTRSLLLFLTASTNLEIVGALVLQFALPVLRLATLPLETGLGRGRLAATVVRDAAARDAQTVVLQTLSVSNKTSLDSEKKSCQF